MAYLKYRDLSLPKLNTDPNHWADHIEFLCFLSQEGYLSEQQIVDRVLDENANNSLFAVNDLTEQDEIQELVENQTNYDPIAEDEIIDESQNNSVFYDKVSSKVKIIFSLLLSRQRHFGDDYPFYITSNEILFKEDCTIPQRLYLILVCSSLLRLATKSGINRIGHLFEELCEPAFNQLLPSKSDLYFLGAGSGNASFFKGRFYDKVIALCDKLHVSKSNNFTKEYAGKHNTGDGGIDWVGVYSFSDNQFSQPVFFGQCACGTDWIDKQFDAHKSKWRNYIQFASGYLTYHFIPGNYRDESLFWFNPLEIYDVVLIDRYRMIELLKVQDSLEKIISIYDKLFEEIENNKIDSFM